jgi:hypothetical protein
MLGYVRLCYVVQGKVRLDHVWLIHVKSNKDAPR